MKKFRFFFFQKKKKKKSLHTYLSYIKKKKKKKVSILISYIKTKVAIKFLKKSFFCFVLFCFFLAENRLGAERVKSFLC